MNKNIKKFIGICKQTQKALKGILVEFLKANGYNPIVDDGYIYAPGVEPVCITAHLDTVHAETVKEVHVVKGSISSPQGIGGDDRCGVYMIMELVRQGLRPYILFCEDEEIGGVGSKKFVDTKHLDEVAKRIKFFIELDRANEDDLVYYNDDNKEFHKWCEKVTGYREATGSFSDISNLCPEAGISGVNISCGYYRAHTLQEFVVWDEMLNSIKATRKLIEAARELEKPWEYMRKKFEFRGFSNHRYVDDYIFIAVDGTSYIEYGETPEEAVGSLMMNNPDLKWNDIIDYYNMYDYEYYMEKEEKGVEVI